MTVDFSRILKKDKGMFLAYDQGLEHGPSDFNLDNCDPNYILDIAKKGKFNAVILQKGIAEKYYEPYAHDVPLILKLNGKSRIPDIEPISAQLCSVKKAVKLGAAAIGYTIYDGSALEPQIFKEFSMVQEEAHDYGLPVIAWIYPRGSFVKDEDSTSLMAYSCRIGLELGADIIKIRYNGDPKGLEWGVKCAGRTKVFVAGGLKTEGEKLLKMTKEIMDAGGKGLAIGRNIWQSKEPLKLAAALKQIVFENASVEAAMKKLK
ncbi:fructose-bisphosphate aldolase [Candidatus Woesearchaeota archaeon]|nr:fructose-bisphosphate aldolase [Candidatus Woesearchaeota archaeon]MBW3016991.1 fructose-bisphosphate aldolase [Candidatus Woesearchaeota archaeon]